MSLSLMDSMLIFQCTGGLYNNTLSLSECKVLEIEVSRQTPQQLFSFYFGSLNSALSMLRLHKQYSHKLTLSVVSHQINFQAVFQQKDIRAGHSITDQITGGLKTCLAFFVNFCVLCSGRALVALLFFDNFFFNLPWSEDVFVVFEALLH